MTARRVFITGGPRTGKTTLARKLAQGGTVRTIHTDDYLDREHADVPSVLREAVLASDDVVVEGTHVARLLRKYPDLAQGARVYYTATHTPGQTPGQQRQAKGIRTVWRQARPALHKSGATVIPSVPMWRDLDGSDVTAGSDDR